MAFWCTIVAIGLPLVFPYIIFMTEICSKWLRRWGHNKLIVALSVAASLLLFPLSIFIVAFKHMQYKWLHTRARRKTR